MTIAERISEMHERLIDPAISKEEKAAVEYRIWELSELASEYSWEMWFIKKEMQEDAWPIRLGGYADRPVYPLPVVWPPPPPLSLSGATPVSPCSLGRGLCLGVGEPRRKIFWVFLRFENDLSEKSV